MGTAATFWIGDPRNLNDRNCIAFFGSDTHIDVVGAFLSDAKSETGFRARLRLFLAERAASWLTTFEDGEAIPHSWAAAVPSHWRNWPCDGVFTTDLTYWWDPALACVMVSEYGRTPRPLAIAMRGCEDEDSPHPARDPSLIGVPLPENLLTSPANDNRPFYRNHRRTTAKAFPEEVPADGLFRAFGFDPAEGTRCYMDFKPAPVPGGRVTLRRHAGALGNGRLSTRAEPNFSVTTGNSETVATGQHLPEVSTKAFASLVRQDGGFAFPMNAVRNDSPFQQKGMTFVYSIEDFMLEVWEGEILISVDASNTPLFTVAVKHPDADVTATGRTIEVALLAARRQLLSTGNFRTGKEGAAIMAQRRQ